MSKKSRKRNKKILGALAAGLGAMALMKRRKLANATDTVNPVGGVDQMAADAATKVPFISKKDVLPKTKVDTGPVLNVTGGIHAGKPAKGMLIKQRALTAGNRVPPSMRGGALHAEGYQRRIPGQRHYPGGWEGGYSMRAKGGRIGAKKGGSVTGIAKRGFGRALMKGKK